MSDLDKAANQDSVLTTSNTVFVTVYGKGNKITRTKMTCDFIRFLLNRILVMVFRRKIRIGLIEDKRKATSDFMTASKGECSIERILFGFFDRFSQTYGVL